MQDHAVDQGRARLREVGRSVSFRAREYLLAAGALSNEVLLLESGLVKVVLTDCDGMQSVVGLYGRGDLVGEIGVLGRQPRSAHVVALRSGRAVHVGARAFIRLRETSVQVRALIDQVSRKRQNYADTWQLVQARDVATRVATVLLIWAREFGSPTDQGLLMRGLSQRDIAQAVSASEKTVETALSELRAAGLLRTGRLRYLLPDPAGITEHVGGCPQRRQ